MASYSIGSEDGKQIANSMKAGDTYKASDGSTWKKNSDGSVSVTTKQGGYTSNAYSSPSKSSSSSPVTYGSGKTGNTYYDPDTGNVKHISETPEWLTPQPVEQARPDWIPKGVSGTGGYADGSRDVSGTGLNQNYYEDILREQQKAARERTQAALEANNAYIPQVNQYADRRLQDAYISKELNRVNMPQQLSALGYSGGATETSMMDAQTGYENRRIGIDEDRNQALGDIRQNAAQIEATGSAGLSDLSANYYQNLVNKQMRDQENALTQNRWQTEFNADRADTAYNNKLRLAQYMAELGDYSGLRELGINVNALNDMNGSTPTTKAAPAKVTATTPASSGNYNTVLNNVKRALGGSNSGSQMSWNAAVNYIQNSLKNGTITEYEAQQMLGQLGLD